MSYVDKIQNKAGTVYDIQDARIEPVTSSVAGQVVMANAQGTGLTYGTVDVSGAISTHNTAADAHTDIRNLITAEASARSEADAEINAKIPSQASSSNQLADKEFVNSSVATNTANYISDNGQPFTSVAALEAYAGTVTNNDYAFVTGTDEAGNTYFDRYKATVSGSTKTWAKEYRLNNSSFTAAQWAAISSGITASHVSKINGIQTMTGTLTVSAGSTANVTFTGISANCVGVLGLAPSASSAQYAAAAKAQLQVTAIAANTVTIRANGTAGVTDLPIVLNIMSL